MAENRKPVTVALLSVVSLALIGLVAFPSQRPRGGPGGGKPAPREPADDDQMLQQEIRQRAGRPQPKPGMESVKTVKIAQLTGPRSLNDNRQWRIYGTDLGHTFWVDGRLAMVFGDTFGGPNIEAWRSNTMAWVTDSYPPDGLWFASMVTGRGGMAAELLSSRKIPGVEKTVIPTFGVSLGNRLILHYMSVRQWQQPGDWDVRYSGLAYSDDGGRTWTKHPRMTWGDDSGFAQVTFVKHDGWLYLFGIPEGRFGPAYLARVRPGRVFEPAAYQYWDGGRWANKEAVAAPVVPAPVGELSVVWSQYHKRWLMAYGDENRNGIVVRTARALTGPWSGASLVTTGVDHPQLYAPYILPVGIDSPQVYFTMSQYDPYQVFLMRTTLLPPGSGTSGLEAR